MTAPTSFDSARALDGNAAAGILAELFDVEMTLAAVWCAGCGATGPLGSLRLYMHGMGLVLRCPGCDDAVVRIARCRTGYRLDLRGANGLEIPRQPA